MPSEVWRSRRKCYECVRCNEYAVPHPPNGFLASVMKHLLIDRQVLREYPIPIASARASDSL
jgi:hypothetical protein